MDSQRADARANTYVKTFNGVRWVVAYRDIEPRDEITYDYCINSYGHDTWECRCGHPKCRKLHKTDFFELPDEKLREYLPVLDDWYVALSGDRVAAARHRLALSDDLSPAADSDRCQ